MASTNLRAQCVPNNPTKPDQVVDLLEDALGEIYQTETALMAVTTYGSALRDVTPTWAIEAIQKRADKIERMADLASSILRRAEDIIRKAQLAVEAIDAQH